MLYCHTKGLTPSNFISCGSGGSSLNTRIKANAEEYEGHRIGNTLERGSPKSDPLHFSIIESHDGSSTQKGGFTQDKKSILMNSSHDTEINRIHEFGHTLGLDDNVQTGAMGGLMEYPPSSISQKEANQLGNSGFLPAVENKER